MNNLMQDIINVHAKIEEELNFVIDIDYNFTNKLFDVLDDLDSKFITIEENDIEKIITLYTNEQEGLIYLEELKKLLSIIKKKCLKLNLQKLKLLLRRKKKKEELLLIIRLLKEQERIFNENINYYTKEEQKEIKDLIEKSKEILKRPQQENIKPSTNLKDNIKMVSMISATSLVGATQVLLEKNKKEIIEENAIKKEKSDKIKDNIKITAMLTNETVASAAKTIISKEDEKIKPKRNETTTKDKKEVVITVQEKENIKKKQKEIKNEDYLTEEEIIKALEAKEDQNKLLKNTLTAASIIGLGTTTVIAAPTIAKASLAVGVIKVLSENEKENEDLTIIEDETLIEEKNKPEESLSENQKNIQEQQEVVDLIEDIEEEQLTQDKIQEIIKENGLDEEKSDKNSITKEERKKVLKMNFENNKTKPKKKKLRLLKKKEEKKKIIKKKEQPKENTPFKYMMHQMGRLASLIAVNIALFKMIQNPLINTMKTPQKTKVLK